MNFQKYALLLATSLSLPFCAFAKEAMKNETLPFGIVNFAECYNGSKYGQKEQENLQGLRKQLTDMLETAQNDLKEVSTKLQDQEYLENLSEKAIEELKTKQETITQELIRSNQQYSQILQQQYTQGTQKVAQKVIDISEKMAQQENFAYVANKELFFYCNPKADLTSRIISTLDEQFDAEQAKELAKKEAQETAAKAAFKENALNRETESMRSSPVAEEIKHFDDEALSVEEDAFSFHEEDSEDSLD